jgi:asparagine synthase (glutamine-hydrolysing)
MCGITGWFGNPNSAHAEHIEKMQNALSPRGPDGEGIWSSDSAILAHRRLSIIDIDGGAQPMFNERKTVVVVFNGELYNYLELRAQLVQRGHVFRTRSDTEVLVHLYEEHGTGMLDMLDGMFAFVIYDIEKRTALLARDRIGIKPLYFYHSATHGELVFASDMTSMLANPLIPRRLNLRALAQYLHFGYVLHPATWLLDVRQLEPGQYILWNEGKLETRRYYYWKYTSRDDWNCVNAALPALRERMQQSVASHMLSDVSVGSFLSGGIDSTVVTGLAQQALEANGARMRSFTVRFWQPEFDESARASAIARDIGSVHTEIDAFHQECSSGFFDRFLTALGEPFADDSALAVYLLCREARNHVKVALSGDGGDELFFGYRGLPLQHFATRLRAIPKFVRSFVEARSSRSSTQMIHRVNKYVRLSLEDNPGIIISWHKRTPDNILSTVLGSELYSALAADDGFAQPEMRDWIGSDRSGGFLEQQLRFQILVNLPCDMLFKVDRMSMAHGMEVRVPILSNTMIDFGCQLPASLLMHSGRTKEPLRTLGESLSSTLRTAAPKRGFSFPLLAWLRDDISSIWNEWSLSKPLSVLGFNIQDLDALVSLAQSQSEHHENGTLYHFMFDLFLLGRWLQMHHVSV